MSKSENLNSENGEKRGLTPAGSQFYNYFHTEILNVFFLSHSFENKCAVKNRHN